MCADCWWESNRMDRASGEASITPVQSESETASQETEELRGDDPWQDMRLQYQEEQQPTGPRSPEAEGIDEARPTLQT